MADIKAHIPGERGARGERGHRGHRGHNGATGPTGPTGPAAAVNVNPETIAGNGSVASPFDVINVAAQSLVPLGTRQTIYVRLSGNDATGDGKTPTTAYRTLPRAMLDVPLFIPPNLQIVVDISGLGLETLPQDYTLPPITQGAGADFDFSGVGPAAFQTTFLPLTIYAEPQLVAAVPAGEAVINPGDILSDVADPNTGLRTLTLTPAAVVTHPSWATTSFKGDFAVGSLSGLDNGTILGSTANSITYAAGAALTAPISLMESSTTLTGSVSPNAFFHGVLTIIGSTNMSLLGVSVMPPLASGVPGLLTEECQFLFLRLGKFVDADLEDAFMRVRTNYFATDSLGLFVARGNWGAQNSLFEGPISAASMFGDYTFQLCKLDGVERLGEVNDYLTGMYPFMAPSFNVQRALIVNSPSDAVVFHGSRGALDHVTINASTGNAVVSDGGFLDMISVQGTGNGGLGLLASDGALVRADANTNVTGTPAGNDVKSGNLAATTWASLPQFDITAVGPGGATGSGTNVYPA
jgi:hypothetical protein